MMGLASLFMVACNNAPKQQEQTAEEPQQEVVTEQHQCPFCTLKAEYANWENMDETAKAELNTKALSVFAEFDAKMAEMKAEGKECCEKKEACEQKMAEMTEEQKAECEAKCAEMKAQMDAVMEKWANIETMTVEEVKDLVLERIAAMGMGQCKHDAEEAQCGEQPAEAAAE